MFQRLSRHLFLVVVSIGTITTFLFFYREPAKAFLSKTPISEVVPFDVVEHQEVDPYNVTKVLVIASLQKDNTNWIDELLPDWSYVRYLTDQPRSKFNVPMNKGNEAMVYLTYIIDNYDKLPDIVVFHHAERFQWHNDDPFWDSAWLLKNLQIPYILSRPYTNLRCVWTLGCPSDLKGINQPWPTYLEPDNEHLSQLLTFQYAVNFNKIFPEMTIPPHVSVPCCAQFAVPRSSILSRSRAQYVAIRDWLVATKLGDEISGRIFEFAWHIMFGAEAFDCPDTQRCYCHLYGVCDLADRVLYDDGRKGCERGSCGDRWDWPPDGHDGFPRGWPEVGWNGELRLEEEVEELRRLGRADRGKKEQGNR